MIKNIIFDLGGVLVNFDPVGILVQMKLSPEAVKIIAEKTVLGIHWKELDRGVLPKETVFENMINDVPDEYKESARKFLYNETLKTVTSFGYAEEWVKSLKESGKNIYLLTNYPDWMFDYHWENAFTFTKYVDGKIVSGKVKLIKPDYGIYNELLNKYNLNPQECVFIDDRKENVEAAQQLGIKGIHFTELSDVKKQLENL